MAPPSHLSSTLSALRARLLNPAGLAWLCFAGLLVPQLLFFPPFAQDDLLRDVVAYAWHFDYRQLYPYSPGVPSFDPYLGFDMLLAGLSKQVSAVFAMHLAQLAGVMALTATLVLPLRRLPDASFRIAVAVFLVAATLTTSRLVGGRPEIWATAWLLSAASLPRFAWLALGVLLSPFYWLMPLYAVGGFLLQARWSTRILSVAGAAISSGLFWLGYAGTNWIRAVISMSGAAAHRPVFAAEAAGLPQLFHYPGTWLLAGASTLALLVLRTRILEFRWAAAAALFLLVGTTRHILVLAPLLALWLTHQYFGKPGLTAWSALMLLALVSAVLAMQQLPVEQGPRFSFPPGSRVLTGYQPGVFSLPFYNPGRIAVAPSVESAWDSPQIVALARAAQSGTLSCADLAATNFTHVVTLARVNLLGRCLERREIAGGWALWRVRTPKPELGSSMKTDQSAT